MSLWIIWLIATAVLLVIELLTGLVATFCVAVGCLMAFVAALVGFGIEVQLGALVVGVILAFKGKKPHRPDYNSNMDALIGREGFLSREIPADGGLGRLRIDGDDWQVRSNDGSSIAHGTKVRVTGYDSIILTVKPV